MNQDPELEKLDAMAARIRVAEEHQSEHLHKVAADNDPIQPLKISGIGFDFVGAVLVCGFFGWLADRELGTKPWGIVVMLIIGFAIGITNVWRSLAADPKKD